MVAELPAETASRGSAQSITRASVPPASLRVLDLGLIPYVECWELQEGIAAGVGLGEEPDTLLLLEHPHTFTCGRRGGREHILASIDELQRQGITVVDVNRGGDVTYHGPGQLVAYPIINLHRYGEIDYPGYVRALEQVLVGTLADFAISSHILQGLSGAWVTVGAEERKIAAIGVRVDGRGVTSHGIALNVTTDMRLFDYIVPCGIADKGVASMEQLLISPLAMADVKATFVRTFADLFAFEAQVSAREDFFLQS